MKIVTVAGARPNFMKVAPVVHALKQIGVGVSIIHTGQHYDKRMSESFFEELAIPEPDCNLGVGSGGHVWQIAEIMKRIEPEFQSLQPDAVVVVGDVNSTVAAAIAAVKSGIPVAHVEAGLRSFDRTMPEEINRILTDSISQWLFTSEPSGEINLRREGIAPERIHFVGNVMIDTLVKHRERAANLKFYEKLGVNANGYAVLTLHRPSNVDCSIRLTTILDAIHQIAAQIPVVFIVHPRTRARLQALVGNLAQTGIIEIEPLGYLNMISVMQHARFVMTDSGGIQEETTALGVPCLTLRQNTERPVTVVVGSNKLVGWHGNNIIDAARHILERPPIPTQLPDKWDGHAADRIARILTRDLGKACAEMIDREPH